MTKHKRHNEPTNRNRYKYNIPAKLLSDQLGDPASFFFSFFLLFLCVQQRRWVHLARMPEILFSRLIGWLLCFKLKFIAGRLYYTFRQEKFIIQFQKVEPKKCKHKFDWFFFSTVIWKQEIQTARRNHANSLSESKEVAAFAPRTRQVKETFFDIN